MVWMKKQEKTQPNDKELLELGKKLRDFYEMGYINIKRALLFSFLKGLATGLGALVGTTIILALILGILSLLTGVPLIGQLFELLRGTLTETN